MEKGINRGEEPKKDVAATKRPDLVIELLYEYNFVPKNATVREAVMEFVEYIKARIITKERLQELNEPSFLEVLIDVLKKSGYDADEATWEDVLLQALSDFESSGYSEDKVAARHPRWV
jgi:hypothetical protein